MFKEELPETHRQIAGMSFSKALGFLTQCESIGHPFSKLKTELLALSSKTKESDWPAIMAAGVDYIQQSPLLLKEFLANYQDIKPLLSASFASIPSDSASKLIALYENGILHVEQSHSVRKNETSHSRSITVDAKGVLGKADKLATLKKLIEFSDKDKTYACDKILTDLSISHSHELLRNGKSTGVFIGSAYATPWYINVPGLDSCASFAKKIAMNCIQNRQLEEAVGE